MTPQTPQTPPVPPVPPTPSAPRARRTSPAAPVPRTVPEMLALRAEQEPERTAIVVEGEGTLTFGEWERRSHAVAHGLLGRGVRPGDRVGLLFGSRDWADFAVAYCAVQLAGAVAVPLSDRLAPAELRYMLGHCEASAVLCGRDLEAPDGDRWTAAPAELEEAGSGPAGVRVAPEDLAQILYTSGTTGTPKGVGASHANLAFGCETRPNRRRFGHSRHLLHAFPIGTNAGQTMLLNALDARPAMLTPARFTPGRFARLIESYGVGTVFLVPTMAIELLNAGLHERHDFSSVVLLGSAASALPPSVSVRLTTAFPNATVTNYYTSTEAAPAQTIMIFDPARPGALGRPASGGALRVVGPDGEPLPPGETGEVWMRSPAPRSYYRDEQASAEAFRGGWVRMGDLGYLDADGYLHLVDREGDVVKSGAFKVSTLQVEAALYEHPQIAEAAVVGVPHPVLGTAIAAAVVPRSGGEVSVTDLRAFLMERLAGHELPERVLVVDVLPKNQSGKVIKRELRGLFGAAATGRTEGT
ncbi:class I adenylate-forming enzyme family protein [Planomonospora sp. ID91781]|uniref:class I adenylate-forming enzyme family protein n=1 Tax=Planomonospora sp. ID91781 TaxID=2738135 RepID=UPI0027DE4448|nr:class I adenylate-forming enzyme family protein [Planomonospora sp. ID91781]